MFSHTSWRLRATMAAGLLASLACAPDALAQPGAGAGAPGGNNGGGNNAPSIASLESKQLPGRKFQIKGSVSDDTPGSCAVIIAGAANGVLMCDSSGNFDGVFSVPTPGPCTAVVSDGRQSSTPWPFLLSNHAPGVSVAAVQGPNNAWTFRGSVTDEAPEGLIVSLSGVVGLGGVSAVAQADGSWSVTVTLSPGAGGTVTATVTDWYGLTGSGSTFFGS